MQLEQVLDTFPWESEEQKRGVFAFLGWYRQYVTKSLIAHKSYPRLENDTIILVAFIAQKTHESNEWWRDTLGDQLRALQDQVKALQDQVRALAPPG